MFVMKYNDFMKYGEWIFAVLSKVELHIPYQFYTSYQKRALAFMAERLINVYVIKTECRRNITAHIFMSIVKAQLRK